ncbi:MAG: hypothetical protein ACRDBM_17285 [Sporomusa sp.]
MAYSDFTFYTDKYFGDTLVNANFNKYAERASDFMDTITFKRLVDGLPTAEWSAKRVQKCVCALAETYYLLDEAQKAASATVTGESAGTGEDDSSRIKSKSSGSESITYMTPAEIAGNTKNWSMIYTAANDKAKTDKLLYKTAKDYLSGVSDDSGTLLLYAGV